MAVYARALLPRILVISVVWITASGTLTFAADKTLTASHPAAKPPSKDPAAEPSSSDKSSLEVGRRDTL